MNRAIVVGAVLLAAACSQAEESAAPEASMIAESAARVSVAAEASEGSRVDAWLRAAYPDTDSLMVRTGQADLDGDGADEVLAYVGGPLMCGSGGCNLVVLRDDGGSFTRLGELSVTRLPVGVLDSETNGMRDLAVTTYGGGASERIMKVPFDGTAYASNPTVGPATESDTLGTEIIGEGELRTLD